MHAKFLIGTAYATIVGAFATIITLGILWLYPWHAVDVYNQPYLLEDTEIEAGEWIKYQVEYCRYTDVDSRVTHDLISGLGAVYSINPDIQTNATTDTDGIRLTEGCGVVTKAVFIPDFVPAGTYKLRETVTYPINFLHTTPPYIFETEEFTVLD